VSGLFFVLFKSENDVLIVITFRKDKIPRSNQL
jgi:hypothetical protein